MVSEASAFSGTSGSWLGSLPERKPVSPVSRPTAFTTRVWPMPPSGSLASRSATFEPPLAPPTDVTEATMSGATAAT
ncbi:hypothetical protein D9M69_718330 [compost metagenome]